MISSSSPSIDAAWHRCRELMPTRGKPTLVLQTMPATSTLGAFYAGASGIGVGAYGDTEVEALDKLAEHLQERLIPVLDLGPEGLNLR